ncbi:MAG: TonB-dependent receptor, partial [Myxococcota bacterium]
TKSGDDLDGVELIAGAGTGPGEIDAAKVAASYGGTFFEDQLKIYSHLSFFTTRSAEWEMDNQKVVGVLPQPSPDGASLYLAGPVTTDPSREFFFNWIGKASFRSWTLEWMVPWEQDGRQLATGGAVLTADYRLDPSGFAFDVETQARDSITTVALGYNERFASDSFGLSLKAFWVDWNLEEDPFGAFPPSNVSATTSVGVFTRLIAARTQRLGLTLDMDLKLPANNRLTFGGEAFQDSTGGIESTSLIDTVQFENLSPEQQQNSVSFEGPDGSVLLFTEPITLAATRNIAALYLRDEFKATNRMSLSAGARLQVSDSYDPTYLFSAAMVWNLFEDTFMKLNYAEGFRPPNFQATSGNNNSVNAIRFEANPNLDVEQSRAGEIELNTVFLKGRGFINRLYIRVDYALSLLDDVIEVQQGRFFNSGQRLIHSTEAFGRLELRGGHEIWAAHAFVHVEDSEAGTIRNIANHTVNVGAKAMLLPNRWELSGLVTWIGEREDRNRAVDPDREPFADPFVPVYPTDVVIDRLEPVWLLRVGTRVLDLYDTFTVGVYGYNVLDQNWSQPDLFFDGRLMNRPFPQPRWSVFGQVEARF